MERVIKDCDSCSPQGENEGLKERQKKRREEEEKKSQLTLSFEANHRHLTLPRVPYPKSAQTLHPMRSRGEQHHPLLVPLRLLRPRQKLAKIEVDAGREIRETMDVGKQA